eukprot:4345372-Prymnesium_polylepis.1
MLPLWRAVLGVVNLLIDTDMSIDVDDVGALCVAHALADRGEAHILAVLQNTGFESGGAAVSIVNKFYVRHMRARTSVSARPGQRLSAALRAVRRHGPVRPHGCISEPCNRNGRAATASAS